ncbi:MAG: hypothetical protein IPK14_08480 [Blastocatellia bacterium]|nr:hypothetical protein [Blastocatellia bacterium]
MWPAFGVNNFEVWLQTISPKAETPVHKMIVMK